MNKFIIFHVFSIGRLPLGRKSYLSSLLFGTVLVGLGAVPAFSQTYKITNKSKLKWTASFTPYDRFFSVWDYPNQEFKLDYNMPFEMDILPGHSITDTKGGFVSGQLVFDRTSNNQASYISDFAENKSVVPKGNPASELIIITDLFQ